MQILNFIKSLLPTFSTSNVSEDIRLTKAELHEHTIPAYNTASELLGKWKFKSKLLEKNLSVFDRMVKVDRGDNIVTTISKAFPTILENLAHVETMIDKTFSEDVAAFGLTFKSATLLQYADLVAFVSKYSRKYLNYIYICETSEYSEDNGIVDSLSPAEIEWLNANFLSFCTAFNIVSGKPEIIEKQLSNIPDVIVTDDNVHTITSTMGASKVDPFQMGLIPVIQTWPLHVAMFFAEWQADRYKAAKEEVKLLQLRKINLEKLADGKPDARIQKEIEYMQGRVESLNFKIAKLEKEASIT